MRYIWLVCSTFRAALAESAQTYIAHPVSAIVPNLEEFGQLTCLFDANSASIVSEIRERGRVQMWLHTARSISLVRHFFLLGHCCTLSGQCSSVHTCLLQLYTDTLAVGALVCTSPSESCMAVQHVAYVTVSFRSFDFSSMCLTSPSLQLPTQCSRQRVNGTGRIPSQSRSAACVTVVAQSHPLQEL